MGCRTYSGWPNFIIERSVAIVLIEYANLFEFSISVVHEEEVCRRSGTCFRVNLCADRNRKHEEEQRSQRNTLRLMKNGAGAYRACPVLHLSVA